MLLLRPKDQSAVDGSNSADFLKCEWRRAVVAVAGDDDGLSTKVLGKRWEKAEVREEAANVQVGNVGGCTVQGWRLGGGEVAMGWSTAAVLSLTGSLFRGGEGDWRWRRWGNVFYKCPCGAVVRKME